MPEEQDKKQKVKDEPTKAEQGIEKPPLASTTEQ